MTELRIQEHHYSRLRSELLKDNVERCAVLLCHRHIGADRDVVICKSLVFPSPADYQAQNDCAAELTPFFVAEVTARARRSGMTLVFVHSHPFAQDAVFSGVDDEGEQRLSEFLALRIPEGIHLALLFARRSVVARELGKRRMASVVTVGKWRKVEFDAEKQSATNALASDRFDRQVRAIGGAGQAALSRLRVAVVGLGGTGSIVAQELAHLGLKRVVLIDPDVVEATNLNRLIGAVESDVGNLKVDVAGRAFGAISGEGDIQVYARNVVDRSVAARLLDVDVIFGCTDSHASRAVLNQIAYQHLIPTIDMGSVIGTASDAISHMHGRVQLLSPGIACLDCGQMLDPRLVREEMLDEEQKRSDPYVLGQHREPAPAVVSLNGTVSSLAVTMFLDVVLNIGSYARHLIYDALQSRLRHVEITPRSRCYVCSDSGYLATGDSSPLLTRAA